MDEKKWDKTLMFDGFYKGYHYEKEVLVYTDGSYIKRFFFNKKTFTSYRDLVEYINTICINYEKI